MKGFDRMSVAANADTGVNLSSKYYLRNFYSSERTAGDASVRHNFSASQLSFDDATALRRAVKKLGSFPYDADSSTNIRSSVKAYAETYNNLITSGEETGDNTVGNSIKKLKSLTEKYKDDLDKVGITVNNDGTLSTRDTMLANADISKFQELFSGESEFMQKTNAFARRIEHQSEQLITAEKNRLFKRPASTDKLSDTQGSANLKQTSQATDQIAAASADLEALLNTGIGQNIDLVL